MKSLEYSEYIVWGRPWQILGAIRAVARAGERGEVLFCQVNNARLYRFRTRNIPKRLLRRTRRHGMLQCHEFDDDGLNRRGLMTSLGEGKIGHLTK